MSRTAARAAGSASYEHSAPVAGAVAVEQHHLDAADLAEAASAPPPPRRDDTFALIQLVTARVKDKVDSTMSWETIRSPSVDISLIRPLLASLLRNKHVALIYALLVARLRFMAEAELELAFQGLFTTRAMVCELLCIRALSTFASEPAELIDVLTTSFAPMTGATVESFEAHDRPNEKEMQKLQAWSQEESQNVLELAITAEARRFIATPLCQRVLGSIYSGDLSMDAPGGHALLADDYKSRPVQAYDARDRPWLDHYLLRVPRIRTLLDWVCFVILVLLFISVLKYRNLHAVNAVEVAFIIFTFGFALDELAQATNGLYLADMWNALDATFVALFLVFLALRIYGFAVDSLDWATFAFDWLAMGAIVLFPRAVGVFLGESIVILGIQSMFRDFIAFIVLAAISASGFVWTLTYMADGKQSAGSVAYLLLKIWFGNSYAGFDQAGQYSVLGPTIIVLFAALANLLLLTILIAILSADFSTVSATATEAYLFQRALRTLERVRSEALHEFLPPLNILAFAILLPASRIASPRTLHRLNVLLSRVFNAPLLLAFGLWARYRQSRRAGRVHLTDESWSSLLSLKSRKDDLAIRPFERAVTEQGRHVEGLELPDASGKEPAEALKAALASPKGTSESTLANLAAKILHLRKEAGPVVEQSLQDRLNALEDGQKEILTALRALLDEGNRSNAESEGGGKQA